VAGKPAQPILQIGAGTRSACDHCANASRWRVDNEKEAGADMTEQELRKKLELLKTEHRDLDAAIAALTEAARSSASADMLQIARLRKRKLRLKDQIAIIEDTLLPDIIA
jgi:hypothetical protein